MWRYLSYRYAVASLALMVCVAGCNKEAPKAAPGTGSPGSGATPKSAETQMKPASAQQGASILGHVVKGLDGKDVDLGSYKGKVALVVNTASQCGFTRQYADLQAIYDNYKAKGFVVLAFPSNDYGGQEPGDSAAIRAFVDEKFSVSFPMFQKVTTKGEGKAPLFKTLTEGSGADIEGEIRWNFTKFLVNREGTVVARFSPMTSPTSDSVTKQIEKLLAQP